MFQINYNLSNDDSHDYENIDEADLRYYLFTGSIVLKNESNSIIIDWDWVPLLDFVICLISGFNKLSASEAVETEVDFTESGESLIFKKVDNKIEISASFSDEVVETSLASLQFAIKAFFESIVGEITSNNEKLRSNDIFLRIFKECKDVLNSN